MDNDEISRGNLITHIGAETESAQCHDNFTTRCDNMCQYRTIYENM